MADLFSQDVLGKAGCNSATEAFERMGSVWDLRYEEKVFSALLQKGVGVLCKGG